MSKQEQQRRPVFTVSRLVLALLALAAFLAVGLWGYYMAAGEFVSAQLAAAYALLALVGAVAVFFRLRRFAVLFYIGCALGWGAGWFLSGLKGDFAPTAGTICNVFLVAVFALLGIIAQWRAMKRRRLKRKEEQAQAEARAEEERKKAELEQARREREEAEAALVRAAQEAPGEPEQKAPPAE